MTYSCPGAIFGVPTSNAFLTSPKTDFKTNLAIDVPKGVKFPKRTKSFRKFCPLVRLANIFNCKLGFFYTPCMFNAHLYC